MSKIVLQVGRMQATVEDGEWSSDDPDLLGFVRQVDERHQRTRYEPWPDWSVAHEVAALLGGFIVEMEPPEPGPSDRVYGPVTG